MKKTAGDPKQIIKQLQDKVLDLGLTIKFLNYRERKYKKMISTYEQMIKTKDDMIRIKDKVIFTLQKFMDKWGKP